MPKLSVNTWSLQRILGPLRLLEWDEEKGEQRVKTEEFPEELTLLDLPQELKKRGFEAAEVTFAQLPHTNDEYLAKIRQAFDDAGIEFASLLLDYGDLSSRDPLRRKADGAWCRRWIDIAAKAGAKRVRVIPGDAEPDEELPLEWAGSRLLELAAYAASVDVRLMIENIGSLASTSTNCLSLLGRCNNGIGFTADFGNFKENKYRQLTDMAPRAETLHAKAELVGETHPDEEDFRKCMELFVRSGFDGPISIVYEGKGDPWAGIERIRKLVESCLNAD